MITPQDLRPELLGRLDAAVNPPLTPSELKEYAELSVRFLARAARGELAGLDVTPAAEVVFTALRAKQLSLDGQLAAIDVIGRVPGKDGQRELLRTALDQDAKRPPLARLARPRNSCAASSATA